MKKFQNKNCLIIGASGGIGNQIAKKISELNCNLFLVGKNKNKLITLKKEITGKNKIIKVEFETVDLTNDQSINNLIKKIRKEILSTLSFKVQQKRDITFFKNLMLKQN